jgi:uroporphyrinogen III methyltransferase/synthase
VDFFFNRLAENGRDARALGSLRTACIGPVTAERLKSRGIKTDILPDSFQAESIIKAFEHEPMTGKQVLLPRAAEARMILPEELSKMGASVDEIAVYRTVDDTEHSDQLIRELEDRTIDLITFTSSSTVTNFKKLIPEDRFKALMEHTAIAAIGPITAETAEKNGFRVDISAETYTIPGLCDAIVRHYQNTDLSKK